MKTHVTTCRVASSISGGSRAASIRHHSGKFYVAFCTPNGWGIEKGHFSVCEADRPSGPWKRTIFPEYLYDPGLFFDDDGRVYVVHGKCACARETSMARTSTA